MAPRSVRKRRNVAPKRQRIQQTQRKTQRQPKAHLGKRKQENKNEREKDIKYPPAAFKDTSSPDDADTPVFEHPDRSEVSRKLIEVLDRLSYGTTADTPPSVSHWNTPENDQTVREYFNIERRLVSPDDLVLLYFWRKGQYTPVYSRWLNHPSVQTVLNFIEESTSSVNISETELFMPSHGIPAAERIIICEEITNQIHQVRRVPTFRPELEKIDDRTTPTLEAIALQLRFRVVDWLRNLREVLTESPDTVDEISYESLFVKYLEQFNLTCVKKVTNKGTKERLCIPYKDGKSISCDPDILLLKEGASHCCGIVEVKKMKLDPAFKHALTTKPNEGISAGTSKEAGPTEKKKVNFGPEVANESESDTQTDTQKSVEIGSEVTNGTEYDTQSDTQSDKSDDSYQSFQSDQSDKSDKSDQSDQSDTQSDTESDEPEAGDSTMRGKRLPDQHYYESLFETYFGPLFGSVLALDCVQESEYSRHLGIGVVGFKVMFCAFYASSPVKPKIAFKEIPCNEKNKIRVEVTRPLSMLNATDRKEIAKIVLHIADRDIL